MCMYDYVHMLVCYLYVQCSGACATCPTLSYTCNLCLTLSYMCNLCHTLSYMCNLCLTLSYTCNLGALSCWTIHVSAVHVHVCPSKLHPLFQFACNDYNLCQTSGCDPTDHKKRGGASLANIGYIGRRLYYNELPFCQRLSMK